MKQYHEHLKVILEQGTPKDPERGQEFGTLSLFGYQNRYKLSEGFPILTTKKVSFKNIVVELLWFLRGDTNIKYLVDNGVNIWNDDAYEYYLKYCGNFKEGIPHTSIIQHIPVHEKDPSFRTFTQEEFLNQIKKGDLGHDRNYKLGDCGYQYGKVWRDWGAPIINKDGIKSQKEVDQIKNIINRLKTSPGSRRHIITAVDPAHDTELALYWCHALFQFNTRKLTLQERYNIYLKSEKSDDFIFGGSSEQAHKDYDKIGIPSYYLDCQLYQRSADMFLGVPYNISSYALLIHIIAKICNMIPGDFIHTFGDSHIYDNHKEQVQTLLDRDYNKYKLPTVIVPEYLNDNRSLDEIINDLEPEHFKLEEYESYPAIKADLVTGLKK